MIGSKIKELRLRHGLTVTELARKVGVSKSYISGIERGVRENVSTDILSNIATTLEVNISELFKTNEPTDELEEDLRLLFSKVKNLSKEDRQKLLKIVDIFTEENNN